MKRSLPRPVVSSPRLLPPRGARRIPNLILSAACALLLPQAVKSATLIWDADGTSGGATGGPGTWDTASPRSDNAGTMQLWDNLANDTAVFGGTAGTVTLGTSITAGALTFNVTGYTLAPTASETLTLAGGAPTISVTNSGHEAIITAALAGASGFKKAGAGTLTLQGSSTATLLGTLTLDGGTLKLSGAGELAGATAVTFANRATLTLDNSGTNLADRTAGAIASASGTINFLGNGSAASSETLGAVTLNAGALTLNSTPGSGQTVTLTIPSITRNAGGTLYVTGSGLGTASNQVLLTTAPALTSSILKYAVVNDGTVTRFATHGGNGTSLAPLTTGYQAAEGSWAAGVNALPTTSQTLTAARAAYSLTLDNGVGLLVPTTDRTFTLSGALLQSGGSSTIAGSGTFDNILAWVANEAIIFTIGDLTIQRGDTSGGNLTGTGGMAKSGPGKLTVFSNGITGTMRLNEGTYRAVTNTSAFGGGSVEFNGGNAELAGDAGVNFNRAVVVNADATITVDRVTAAATTVTHTLGALTMNNGRTLTVSPGSLINTNTAYGLTLGSSTVTVFTTLNSSSTFNVLNNGTGLGTVSLATIANPSAFPITKTGPGDLVTLSTVSGFNSPVEILAGRVGWTIAAGTITDSSVFSGSGGLFKPGNGIVNLTGASTFTGGITIAGSGTLGFSTVSDNGGPASNLGRGTDGINLGATLNFLGSTNQSTNRAIALTGTSTLNANGTGGASITYAGAITGAQALTLGGSGAGFITGGLTLTGGSVDLNISAGTWTFSNTPVSLTDDLVSTGTANINLNGTGILTWGAGASTSPSVFLRFGSTLNLGANEAITFLATGSLVVGDATGTVAVNTLNMGAFNQSVPRLDFGSFITGIEGALNGTGTLTVTNATIGSGINLNRGTVNVNLAGAGAIFKAGPGDAIVRGDNSGLTSTTATRIDAGNLIFDYTVNNTTKVNAAQGLDMRGGILTINGDIDGNTTQSFASFTLASGGNNRITANSQPGFSSTVNLGAVTRATNAGTIRFELPGSGAITTTTANGATGILGGYATVKDFTGTYFAKNDGSNNIVGLTYAAAKNDVTTWQSGDHITDDTTGFTGTLASGNINSLRFNAAGPSTVTIGPSGILSIASGGILQTGSVTAGSATITGGRLGSATGELIFTPDSSAQPLTVASAIGGTTTITKTGNGTLILSGANTTTGNVLLQGGTLKVSGGNAIGDAASVTLADDQQTTLQLLSNEAIGTLSGGNSSTGFLIGTVDVGTNTLTINQTAATTTYAGVFTGSGGIVKNGAGTNLLLNGSSGAGFTGTITVNGGLLHLEVLGTLNATGLTINRSGSFLISNNGTTSSGLRLPDNMPISLNSADGIFNGESRPSGLYMRRDQGSTQNETVGVLTLNSGASYARLDATVSAAISTLIVDNVTRANNATFDVRGTNLVGGSQRAQLQIGTAGNQTAFIAAMTGGAGAAGSKTISIVPWAIAEEVTTGGVLDTTMGNSLATYTNVVSNSGGFRALNLSTEYNTYAAAAATDNTREVLTANLTGQAGKTINSLVLHNNGTAASTFSLTGSGASQTLAVTSGALLFTSANVASAAMNTNLGGFDAGITVGATNEYVIHVVNPSALGTTALVTATISSPLTSAADITKSGRGTLVLTGTNTAGGGARKTTLNEGILQIANLNNIGGATGGLVFAGGTLKLDPAFTDDLTTRTITFLSGGGTLDTNGLNPVFAGSLGSGAGSFTKIGAGNLTLAGSSTFTGATTLSAGNIVLGANQGIGSGDLTIAATSTLDLGTFNASVGNVTLPNSATAAITGTGTLTATGTMIANQGTISPLLAGSFNLIKQTASQTLTLTNPASTFTGYTHVQDGAIAIDSIANAGVASPLGAPTGENAIIRLGHGNAIGTLRNTGAGGATNRDFGLTGTGGGGIIDNDGTGALTLNGNLYGYEAGAKTLTLQGSTTGFNNVVNGAIEDRGGTLSLTKAEAGTWVLASANNYSGITTITGGVLQVNTAMGGLGTSTTANTINLNAGTLRLTNDGTGNNGTIIYGSAANPAGYKVTLTATSTIDVNNLTANTGNTIVLGPLVQPTASARTLNVTGGNGYTLTLASLGLDPGLGQTTTLIPTTASLIIAGNVTNPMTGFAAGNFDTLVLDGTATANMILGSISDAVGAVSGADGRTIITKQNTGTWALSGASSYSGGTNLNGGVLIVGHDQALGTGAITFGTAAGTLHNGDANRTLANNVVLNFSPATLAGTGNFSFTGNLSETGGSRILAINNTGTTTFGDAAADTVTLAESNQTRTMTLQVASTASAIVNATIQDGTGTGADSLIKSGPGSLTLNASNTYTGATTVDNGTVKLNANQTLGATTNTLLLGAAAATITPVTLDLTNASASFGGLMTMNINAATPSTITIGAANALSIGGNVQIGATSPAVNGTLTNLAMTGGGAFNVATAAGGLFTVGGSTSGTNAATTTLDLSGLSSVSINVSGTGTVRINNASTTNVSNSKATFLLPQPAVSNTTPVATITTNNFNVGDSGMFNSQAGQINSVVFGTGLTTLNANNVNVGTGTRDIGSITFGTANGAIKLRAADGTSRNTVFNIATGGATTGTTDPTTNDLVDFTGHDADLLIGTLNIGNQARIGNLTADFKFNAGVLDATGVTVGFRTGTASTSATLTDTLSIGGGSVVIGTGGVDMGGITNTSTTANSTVATFNLSGGTVSIANSATLGGAIRLGNNTAATGLAATTATLNITGGALTLAGSIVKGTNTRTTSTVLLDGATASLDLSGNNIGTASNLITFDLRAGTLKNLGEYNGGAALTKTTSGTLVFDGTNTYSGATNLQQGATILAGTGNNHLPATAAITLGSGANSATLQLGDASGSSNQTLGALATSGTGIANAIVGGHSTFSTLTLNQNTTTTFAGALGGGGANQNNLHFIKGGSGELTLTGANSYAGFTTINAGVLNINSATGLGVTSAITLADGADLNLLFSSPAANVVYTPTGTGTVLTLNQSSGSTVLGFAIDGAFNSQINLGANTLVHTGVISTDIHVNSAPTATQYVLINSAANGTFTGGGSFALGTIFNGGSFVYNLARDAGAANDQLLLNVTAVAAPANVWWKGDLTGTGLGVWNASGLGGNTNWDDAQTGGNDAQVPPDSGSVVHFSAASAANFTTTLGANMTVKKVVFENGSIANGLSVGGSDVLTIGSGSVAGSGGLDVAVGNGTGTIPISAPVVLGVAQSWNIADAASILSLSGGVSGTGPFAINDNGTAAGTVVVTGTSFTYTGATTLAAGRLILDGANRLPTTTALTMGGATTSATLQLGNGTASNTTLGSLASGAATANAIVGGAAANSTLTINQTTAGTFNGGIGGAGANENAIILIKSGPGTLTLNGVNTYTGATTVTNGTLQLGASGSITQSASLAVSASAGSTAAFDVNGRTVTLNATTGAITLGGADSTAMANILDTAGGGVITLGGNVTYSNANNPLGSTIAAGLTSIATPRTILANDSTSTSTELTLSGPISGTGFTTDQRITFDGTGVIVLNGAASVVGSGADLQKNGVGTLTINAASSSADDWLINGGVVNATVSNALNASDDIVITGTAAQDTAIVNISGTAGASGISQGDDLFIRGGGRVNVLVDNGISLGTDLLLVGDASSTTAAAAGRLDLAANISTTGGLQLGNAGNFANITGTGTFTSPGTFSLRSGTVGTGITFDGAAPITKVSTGTVTFSGSRATTATGGTNIQEGNLILDYTVNNSSKIGGILTLGSANANVQTGGALTLTGNASAATAQTVASTTIVAGDTEVIVNNGTGQSATLALGAITRSVVGGTVAFTTSSASAGVTTTSPASHAVGWATMTAGGTTRIAAIDALGNVIQSTAAPQNDVSLWGAGDNVINTGAFTGTIAGSGIDSLTFDAAAASTITIAPGASLSLASGGILVNSGIGANASVITGGSIYGATTAPLGELIVHQNNTAGSLTIASDIQQTSGITKSGAGTLVLGGNNSFLPGSRVIVNEGTLQVTSGRALGDTSLVLIRLGATLDIGSSAETIGSLGETTVNLSGGTINVGSGGSLTINQTAASTFTGTFNGGATASLTKSGAGILTLSNNSSTSFTGTLTVNQGQLLLNNTAGRVGAATIFLNGGELLDDQDQTTSMDRLPTGAIVLNNTAGTNGLFMRTNQGSTRADTIGTVTLGFGANVMTGFGSVTNAIADLNGTTFARGANHATALVRGNNLGASSGTRGQLRFSNAPAGDVGGILPWLVGHLSETGLGNTFVTNTGATNGLRPLASNEYTTNEGGFNALTGASTNNVRFDTTPTASLASMATAINSLVLDATTAISLTGPTSSLEITSGAILAANTGNHTIGGFTGLTTAGGRDYIIHVTTAASTLTLDTPLTTSAVPLVKSGAGTLKLTSTANAFTDVWFNQGAVLVNGYDKLGAGVLNFAGGTLRLDTGFADDLNGRTYNVLMGGGTLDTGAVNVVATNWNLTGTANFAKTGTGTLQLTGATPTGFAGTFNLQHGLLELNKPAGTDAIGAGGFTILTSTSAGTVKNLADEQVNNSALVSLANSGSGAAIWDLNGHTETVGGLTLTTISNTGTSVRTGTTGVLVVNGDITLNHNRASTGNTSQMVEISGTGSPNTGTLDLGGANRVITVESTNSATNLPGSDANIETVIRNGGIIKRGSRALFLTGTNTYSGPTSIQGGMLSIGASTHLGDGSATNTIEIANGAILQSTGAAVNLGANRSITLAGSSGVIDVMGTNVLTIPGTLSGAAYTQFVKTGPGTLVLAGGNTHLGGTTISAGTLQIGNGGALSAGPVTNSGTLSFNRSDAYTVANIISGTGAVTHLGAGITTLSGLNTYTGATTINAGVLNVTGALAATAVAVNGGGALAGTGLIGTLSGGSVTLAGGATPATRGAINLVDGFTGTLTLQSSNGSTVLTIGTGGNKALFAFEIGAPGSNDKIVIANGALLSAAAGGALVNIAGLAGLGTGTYDLVSFGAGNASGFANLSLGTLPGGAFNYALNETSTAWQLIVTAAAAGSTAYWRGDQSASWTTVSAGATNWYADAAGTTNSAAPDANTDVFFTASNATGNFSTALGADFSIRSLTFTGPGTPAASNSITIGGTHTLTIGSGGIAVQSGSAAHTISTNLVLGAAQTWTNLSTNPLVVSGAIAGGPAATLTKSGSGTLTLTSGASTFAGGLTVDAGTLIIAANSSPGLTSGPLGVGTLRLNAGSTIQGTGTAVANAVTINGAVTFGGTSAADDLTLSGAVDLGSATRTLTVNAGVTATLSGPVTATSGAGLTKSGPGSLVLSGTGNSWTGAMTIDTGTLRVGGTDVLPDASKLVVNTGNLDVNGHTETIGGLEGTGTITNLHPTASAALAVNLTSGTNTFSGTLTNGAKPLDLTKNGAGTLVLGGANTHTGTTTVSGGTLSVAESSALGTTAAGTVVEAGGSLELQNDVAVDGEALTLNGSGGGNGALRNLSGSNTWKNAAITLGSATTIQSVAGSLSLASTTTISGADTALTVAGSGDTTIAGSIATGTGTLTKAGSGTLTLSGTNTNSGFVAVNAGTVSISASENLGDASATNTLAFAGGTLRSTGPTVNLGANRAVALNSGGGTFETPGTNSLTVSGAITGSASLAKSGSGTLALAGDNTGFSGPITVAEGTLSASASNQLGTGTALTLTGSTLRSTGAVDLGSTRALNLGLGGGTLDVTSGHSLTISGLISGSAGLAKSGPGLLVVSSDNSTTYSGSTTIGAGTFNVANTVGSATGSGAVDVLSTATLTGAGRISGSVTVADGGTINPAVGIGSLSTGPVAFADGAVFALEIDSDTLTGDVLNISSAVPADGTLTLTGAVHLAITNLGTAPLSLHDHIVIATYTGDLLGSGSFRVPGFDYDLTDYTGYDAGAAYFLLDGAQVAIDYNYNDTSTIALVVVPEPSAALALTGAASLLLGLRRFRRRS